MRVATDSGERYNLGNSIRDLLRANPRNLGIREKTVSWVAHIETSAEQALKLQRERNVSPVDLAYMPLGGSPALIAFSKQIKAAAKREDRRALTEIGGQLRLQLSSDNGSSFLHRLYAWTMLELDDVPMAVQHFLKASTLDKSDPSPVFGLALAYQAQQKWIILHETTNSLIENEWGTSSKSGKYYANRIWSLYLQTAIFTEKFSLVFEKTQDWENLIDSLPSLAIGRATAYRQQADIEHRKNKCTDSRLGEYLGKASRLMLKTCISEGFAQWFLIALKKLIGDLDYYRIHNVNLSNFKETDQESIRILMGYCMSNDAVLAGVPTHIAEAISKTLDTGRNPESSIGRKDLLKGIKSKEEFEKDGFTIVKVKYIPKSESFPAYLFANDDNSTDYFVRVETFEENNWNRWALLCPGMHLAIKFVPSDTGNALRTTEAWIVN